MALFAGIGGLETGLQRWVRTVCYIERDHYAVATLRSRIEEGRIHDAPIWDDIRTFDGTKWRGKVDIIIGGFPCQDISNAGKGRGIKKDTRSGLWYEFYRIINEVRPSFVFVENVSALTHRGLDIVLGQLSEAGYDARWTDLRASDVGAPHRRERMFILAYDAKRGKENMENAIKGIPDAERAEGVNESEVAHPNVSIKGYDDRADNGEEEGIWRREKSDVSGERGEAIRTEDVADTTEQRFMGSELERRGHSEIKDSGWTCAALGHGWDKDPAELDPSSESFVGRVVDGIPNRVDRIKCLGNAVVPKQA
ncbi:MAG: DNA cytosine methyltransferase, partial [Candidatus Thermoplasmatota archaeon]|nr:DNA cytosine methyltransferase [Candidatus Thermoplasmatota archaeon]